MAGRAVYFGLFLALLVFFHLTLHLAFGFGAEAPDLMTIAALIGARRLRGAQAAALGFGLGVLDDSLSVTAFGASALALTAVSYVGARSRDVFEGESVLFLLVYLFLGKWLRDVIVHFVVRGMARTDLVNELLVIMPLHAIYAAIAGVVAVVIYKAMSGERA